MSTMDPDELAFHISITPEPDCDEDALIREADRVVEGIKAEHLHRQNTPQFRRDLHKAVGEAVSNLPGVKDVRVTPAVTGNPPTIQMGLGINTRTGETFVTDTKVIEGKPVPRPPWAEERDEA